MTERNEAATIADIRSAAQRLRGVAVRPPLLESPFLNRVAGRRVLVKAECLQRTGSFKFRGAWSAVSALPPTTRAGGVIAFSSGNHAQALALTASLHGIPALIVMPRDAPAVKRANTAAYGAEVVTYDRATESREELGVRLGRERGLTLIRPYDEPMVIAGQGTVGLEIAGQAREAGVARDAELLCCCGGGGLTSGVALALEAEAPGMKVRTVEPEGYDDTARSLVEGAAVVNAPAAPTVCDAIATPTPGELTFPILKRLCGRGIVVTDDEARRAMSAAFTRLRIVLEPGGAVALAAALYHCDELSGNAVVVVASGGNVDEDTFTDALSRFGNEG